MKKFILIGLLWPLGLAAQKNYSDLLQKYMQAQQDVRQFSGSVLVVKQGNILLRKGYGLADMEWNIPNTPDTKFRIGSITKQFTSTSILQLIEAGKLHLDDKLSKFYPGFPKGDSVTIHMLLNHTSGIPSYTSQEDFGSVGRLSLSLDSMINFFKNRPYDFSPGKSWLYNNSGYLLLGAIIEKLSGLHYADYLRKNIFDKLNMKETGVDRLDTILPKRAHGYSKKGKTYINAEFISMEWPFSAGAIYSTIDDLYKWDRALYGESLISNASKQKMFTPGMRNYGYGVAMDTVEKHFRIWHNGGIPGFSSHLSRFVNDDLCIIVLSNNESNVDFVAIALADILFDQEVELPYIHKEVKIDPAILQRYVGKYSGGTPLELVVIDGKLFRHRQGWKDIELKPESETKFFYADESDRQLEFVVDKSGKVIKTYFFNSGQKGEIKKEE